ncbi:MAG: helix-turn-helix domain-containing protein [Fibrella sp.]|nr:helix-turn-helix domain-containing protein [Armatimonadota bacterium]
MTAVAHPPTQHHDFANLVHSRRHTAAGRGLPLLIWRDSINSGQESRANHHNDFYSLYIVQRGRGTHVIDGYAFGVARGDVYAMAPGMTHHFEECHDMVTDTFHFSPALFDSETLDALAETPGFHALFVGEPTIRKEKVPTLGGRWLHLTPSAHAQIASSVDEIRAEWERGDATGTLLSRALFFRLLILLARAYVSASPTLPVRQCEGLADSSANVYTQEATVATALRIMEERFAESVRVEEIARAVFLSPDRFTEVFAQSVGRTPRDYLRYLRVEKAKALLRTGDLSMTEIAQESGFGDPAYFARAFRAAVGNSPSDWKKLQSTKAAI